MNSLKRHVYIFFILFFVCIHIAYFCILSVKNNRKMIVCTRARTLETCLEVDSTAMEKKNKLVSLFYLKQ